MTDPAEPISRRKFLIGAGAVTGAAVVGVTAWHYADGSSSSRPDHPAGAEQAHGGAPLVLVTLYGGNDGINTVVPYTDPAYLKLRPTLGYQPAEVLPLADGLGLNPQLKGLQGLWNGGQLAVVRGVGYPKPNLSHFASTAIWQTGDPADEQRTGWLGRWLDATGTDPLRAVSVGNSLPLALRGERQTATALVGPKIELPGGTRFQQAYAALQGAGSDRSGLATPIAESSGELLAVQRRLDQLTIASPGAGPGPTSDLGGQLDLVASLINAGSPTRAYSVSLASFDTHAGEKANHERLLGELDAAVAGFLQKIAGSEAGRHTVLLTVSEFGRRPAENASGGTDHGTAAPLLVAGHGVNGGRFYGDQPSLTKLDGSGNQLFTVDFRSVFATVLERVIATDSERVLGGSYPILDFV